MLTLALLGCAVSGSDTADPCADAPVLTWADVGQPLTLEYCGTCHTASAPDRQGAPEAVVFDTPEQVATLRTAMLAAVDADPPRMPPLLIMPENEHELLVSWLRCDAGP